MVLPRLGAALLLSVVVAAAACGDAPPDEAAPTERGTEFTGLSAVEAIEARRLTFLTDPLPTAAEGPCRTEAEPRVEEHPSEILVFVDLRRGPAPPYDDCKAAARRVTVELASDLGDRPVRDAFGSVFSLRDGRWVGCDHVVQTCVTDPARCDNDTLRDTIANNDVPRHFGMSNSRCKEPFAVVDVDYGAGACPADEGRNPCAGENVRRMFWRIEDGAWVLVASTVEAGCGDVSSAAADFNTSLCEGLPPL